MPARGPDYMNWGLMRYRAVPVYSKPGLSRSGHVLSPGVVTDFGHGIGVVDGRGRVRAHSIEAGGVVK